MYIFCFSVQVLHNKEVPILKFEDNSMKEENYKNIF
jgi:hypothetical protein